MGFGHPGSRRREWRSDLRGQIDRAFRSRRRTGASWWSASKAKPRQTLLVSRVTGQAWCGKAQLPGKRRGEGAHPFRVMFST